MSALLTIAADKNGEPVSIKDVLTGKKCECTCPYCGSPLEARNNPKNIREAHFKHSNGHKCENYYESQLHLMAKSVIKEAGGIMLPPSDDNLRPSGFVHLENVQMEQWNEKYNFRPDVEGTLPDGRQLYIECLVSHKVTEKKRDIIVKNNLLCVEINLNWLELKREVLLEHITKSTEDRYWIKERQHVENNGGSGSLYSRNPRFDKARDILKATFDNKEMAIVIEDEELIPDSYGYTYNISKTSKVYKLSQYGYDFCQPNTNFRGFKTDLLLYRNNKEDKGFISINFRGRRRSADAKLPKQLRVIDIILRDESDVALQTLFSTGKLSPNNTHMDFRGAWKENVYRQESLYGEVYWR